MELEQRVDQLLQIFLSNSGLISINKLAEDLKVSKRTVQYDLKKLNTLLMENNFSKINYVRGQGYHLSKQQKEKLEGWLQKESRQRAYFTSEERQLRIISYLLTLPKKLLLEDLTEANYVSRNTTLDDLKKIRQRLSPFQLELQYQNQLGNIIVGEEKKIRHFFMTECLKWIEEKSAASLIQMLQINCPQQQYQLFSQFEKAKETLFNAEEELGIQYTDEIDEKLGFLITFFKERMKLECYIAASKYNEKQAHHFAKRIYNRLRETEMFEVPSPEITYLSKFLLSANRLKDDEETADELDECVTQMIREFERLACFRFKDFDSLKQDLILHIKPALNRLRFQVEWINPLFADIKREYNDVYQITQKSIAPIEKLAGQKLSEDEISYISILFGGYLTRNESILVKKKKLLILCSKGIGTSRMLEQQLRDILQDKVEILPPMSIREYTQHPLETDFLVSTIPVSTTCDSSFIVSPILSEEQKKLIEKRILPHAFQENSNTKLLSSVLDIIEKNTLVQNREQLVEQLKEVLFHKGDQAILDKSPSLKKLLPTSRIQILEHVDDWQEAIRIATLPLVEEGFVAKDFYLAMIENIQKLGPYIVIAPGFAFPHGNQEDGAYRVGMSLLQLKKPVAFSEKEKDQVYSLLVLASVDSYTHIQALSQLTNLITKTDFLKILQEESTADKINAHIKNMIF